MLINGVWIVLTWVPGLCRSRWCSWQGKKT